ncbi:MAG: hypothetical protein MSJ26_02035 [Oscillospiraceae bacterium]|nr:hypothetical protein [Oscillospiraceae bacterium]
MDIRELENALDTLREDELERALNEKKEELKNASPKAEDVRKSSAKGHRGRVKERFLKSGLEGFAPHEILELLLFYTIPQRDTKQTAHELIRRFGSVAGVFNADFSALTEVKGITENTAVLFRLIPKLVGVYYEEQSKGVSVTTTSQLSELFKPYFVGSGSEKFMLACFDGDLRPLSVSEISRGSSAYTSVELRKIMSAAIDSNCSMAALAHNHPGGEPKPSDEDIAVTRRINELLRAIDIRLMDHIVVGGSKCYSMRDGGDLGIFD